MVLKVFANRKGSEVLRDVAPMLWLGERYEVGTAEVKESGAERRGRRRGVKLIGGSQLLQRARGLFLGRVLSADTSCESRRAHPLFDEQANGF